MAAATGSAWGSFLGVVVARVPSGGDVLGRSRCDRCGVKLGAWELLPVLSWLWLRGKCRHCGANISVRWPLLELACALAAVTAFALFSSPWTAVPIALVLGVLMALSLIDLKYHRLPNAIVYPTAAALSAWLICGSLLGAPLDLPSAVLGAGAFGGGLLLVALASGGGMGLGDVKLAGVIGLLLGAIDLSSVAVAAAAAVLFGGVSAVYALLRGADRRTAIPFGPMLSLGALLAVVAGPSVADAYMGLLR